MRHKCDNKPRKHYVNSDGVVYCLWCDEVIGEAEISMKVGKIMFYKSSDNEVNNNQKEKK